MQLITILIGQNDLCLLTCNRNSSQVHGVQTAEMFAANVRRALDRLAKDVPKSFVNLVLPAGRCETIEQALFLNTLFSQKANVHLISSDNKCHETSRIFTRTEQWLWFHSSKNFLGDKVGRLAMEGRPLRALRQKYSDDTRNSGTTKSVRGSWNICDCQWHLSKFQKK